MAIRRPDGPWTAPVGLTFRRWLRDGARAVPDVGPPTLSDLQFHLTTLFPPVRARGHLEVRYLDAQPGPWWRVAAAAVSAVVDDPLAAETALVACEPLNQDWSRAARQGLEDAAVRRAAELVLGAAADALQRAGRGELAQLTAEYLDRPTFDPTQLEARPC
jgi:glutamate--cysteine ligase